jgi:hypothetical protein
LATNVATSKVFNGKRRSILIRHAYMRHLLKHGVITLGEVRTHENLADPFTKGLTGKVVLDKSRRMGLRPMV